MEIVVNGNSVAVERGTVAGLLAERDLDPKLVVVELNGKILPRADYETALNDGDAVEIVQFVAGG